MAWWGWLLLYLAFLVAFVLLWKRFWNTIHGEPDHED